MIKYGSRVDDGEGKNPFTAQNQEKNARFVNKR